MKISVFSLSVLQSNTQRPTQAYLKWAVKHADAHSVCDTFWPMCHYTSSPTDMREHACTSTRTKMTPLCMVARWVPRCTRKVKSPAKCRRASEKVLKGLWPACRTVPRWDAADAAWKVPQNYWCRWHARSLARSQEEGFFCFAWGKLAGIFSENVWGLGFRAMKAVFFKKKTLVRFE